MTDPFVVHRPAPEREIPVVVEIPHAGLSVDPTSLAFMVAPLRSLGRDADLFVDHVFGPTYEAGATVLASKMSRFVLDLNRARDDYDGFAVEGGRADARPRGLVWRTTTEGEPIINRRLPRSELERRLALLYDPYHRALTDLLDEKRAKFGHVVLVCAHSMPSTGRRGHVDVGKGRADVVPGTRGRTTASDAIISCVDAAAQAAGYSLKHDDPYQGGHATSAYGKPEKGVHAVQIELARRIYMDEDALTLVPAGLKKAQAFARAVVEAFGRASP
jgi:N-formylglutamate amidohydrolase